LTEDLRVAVNEYHGGTSNLVAEEAVNSIAIQWLGAVSQEDEECPVDTGWNGAALAVGCEVHGDREGRTADQELAREAVEVVVLDRGRGELELGTSLGTLRIADSQGLVTSDTNVATRDERTS
jgi:hypothetical protein